MNQKCGECRYKGLEGEIPVCKWKVPSRPLDKMFNGSCRHFVEREDVPPKTLAQLNEILRHRKG